MNTLKLIKKHAVLSVATLAAIVTGIIVPPDKEYLGYFDFKTLTCLFLTLAVVCALRNIKFFTILARKIVGLTGNLRMLALARESWEKKKWKPCGTLAVLSHLVDSLPERLRRCVEIMDIYRSLLPEDSPME